MNFTLPRRSLLLAPALAALPSWSRANNEWVTQQLQALVNDVDRPVVGLAALAVREGQVVHESEHGLRRVAGEGQVSLPVTRATLYRVASVSKFITGLGALRLMEAGRLDLDADVSPLLGWRLRHPRFPSTPITPRLLLSHRSGLSDAGGIGVSAALDLAQVLRPNGEHYVPAYWGRNKPGSYFQYCNFAYGVLATVMEAASGLRFDRLMQALVLQPLGLTGGFEPAYFSDAERGQMATLYRKQSVGSAGEIWNAAGPWVIQADGWTGQRPSPLASDDYRIGSNGTIYGPQGRLHTSVHSLGRVLQMLVNEGRLEGQSFLSPATLRMICSEQWRNKPMLKNGDDFGGLFQAWGTGLEHITDQGRPGWGDRLTQAGGLKPWGHFGFAYGLQAGIFFDPERRSGVAYAFGGCSADPALNRGRHSSLPIWEERVHELLWGVAD